VSRSDRSDVMRTTTGPAISEVGERIGTAVVILLARKRRIEHPGRVDIHFLPPASTLYTVDRVSPVGAGYVTTFPSAAAPHPCDEMMVVRTRAIRRVRTTHRFVPSVEWCVIRTYEFAFGCVARYPPIILIAPLLLSRHS